VSAPDAIFILFDDVGHVNDAVDRHTDILSEMTLGAFEEGRSAIAGLTLRLKPGRT
jgi:hypothetical protein